MSRLYSNQCNNNADLVNNGDFFSKMMKNKRVENKPRTEPRISRDKSTGRANNQLAVSRPTVKPGLQIAKIEEPRRKSSNEIIHREVINNSMATVEVTVRTVAPENKPIMESKREPWGKILNVRKSDENIQGTFGSFDPLRTLHFLSKELQLKLQNICPSDTNIQQIVNDMQNAMQRLPPDVLSQFKASNVFASGGDVDFPTNIKKSNTQTERKLSKHCQTVIIGDVETKRMQQQLEDSATKLEASCKEMEVVCSKLRTERDELEAKLVMEKENALQLKKDLTECITEKESELNQQMTSLISERDELRKQVTDLQIQLELQAGQTAEDLRTLVEELRNKHLATEQENTAKRNEITLMKLERDKMNVLLECRDKQLRELRGELECIQQLVSSQLTELKSKPALSTTTSMSSTSQLWNVPSVKSQKMGKSIHELFLNNDIMRKMLLNKDLQIAESGTITTLNADEIIKDQNLKLRREDVQEIPQKDKPEDRIKSEMTISDTGMSSTTETEFMNRISSASIKDMFAEIKRQAFKKLDVTLPAPPRNPKDSTSRASLSS